MEGLAAESPVWRRTRARRPMQDISVDELEALLNDDFEQPPVEDDTYRRFLAVRALCVYTSSSMPTWNVLAWSKHMHKAACNFVLGHSGHCIRPGYSFN